MIKIKIKRKNVGKTKILMVKKILLHKGNLLLFISSITVFNLYINYFSIFLVNQKQIQMKKKIIKMIKRMMVVVKMGQKVKNPILEKISKSSNTSNSIYN